MKMVDYALKYWELGYSPIPVSKDKRPLAKFAGKKFTKEEIISLWGNNPGANIALLTDSIFVVDIDRKGAVDGYRSLFATDMGRVLAKNPSLTQTTASGGAQIVYKKPKGVAISQKIGWMEGVDVKASDNNYFLVPPSVTEKGMYKWNDHGVPIAEAPKELVEALRQPEKEVTKRDAPVVYNQTKSNKTTELFETIAEGFGNEGGRNNALVSFAAALLWRVPAYLAWELVKIANGNTADP
ncbi:MAG: bifunctional DNA primase/polymerase, partial [Turicibacter sp.]|nr:bifunctional DNA primase/polymerase [Turicibacter sp.]